MRFYEGGGGGSVSGPGHIITILGQMKALLHVSGLRL